MKLKKVVVVFWKNKRYPLLRNIKVKSMRKNQDYLWAALKEISGHLALPFSMIVIGEQILRERENILILIKLSKRLFKNRVYHLKIMNTQITVAMNKTFSELEIQTKRNLKELCFYSMDFLLQLIAGSSTKRNL